MNHPDTMTTLAGVLALALVVSLHVIQWQYGKLRTLRALRLGVLVDAAQREDRIGIASGAPAVEETDTWREKAAAFQQAVADAKKRSDEAEMPTTCVYTDCDEDPTSSIVDTKGHVTGLCDRHARPWARLDEDERRKVRNGG